ncbi:MAG: ATP-binding cassette domain-containing protein [Pseudomonadales bacterium]|nr:ATP-binding cassette domain-containing protein [Pseudomonadales bacterium]
MSSISQDTYNASDWLSILHYCQHHFRLPKQTQAQPPSSPLNQHQLTTLFEQHGLRLQAVKTQQLNNDTHLLPCIILWENKPALITDITSAGYEVLIPQQNPTVHQPIILSKEQLPPTGFFVCATQPQDARSDQMLNSKSRHWLIDALLKAKPWYRDVLLASFIINIIALLIPLFTMNVYDRVVPNNATETLWMLATGVSMAIVFDWLLRSARSRLTDLAGRQIDVSLSQQLFSKLIGMKLSQRPQSNAAFVKQLQEVDSIREFLTSATLVTLIDVPFAVLFLGLIAWLAGPLVGIPIAAMALLVVFAWRSHFYLKNAIEESGRLSAQRQVQLYESLQMLPDIKQHNREGEYQQKWQQLVTNLSDQTIHLKQKSNQLSHLMSFTQYVVTVALLIGGVYRIHEGLLSMGGMIAIVMLSSRASQALNQIALLLLRFSQTRSAIGGLNHIMELEQENQKQPFNTLDFNGDIQLNNVSLRYGERSACALNALNLHLKAGQRVALLGPSGSGKSSLLSLLASQLEPTTGTLLFDRIERGQWPLSHLRAHIGWLGQQPLLHWGSILENITGNKPIADEHHLRELLQRLEMNRVLEDFESGLQSQVGEGGLALSGGQRQLIALIRTLLPQPQWLMLDEPTNALDEKSQANVISTLQQLPKHQGFVIATHRTELLPLCDRILVLEKGQIILDQPRAQFMQQHRVNVAPTKQRKVVIRPQGADKEQKEQQRDA